MHNQHDPDVFHTEESFVVLFCAQNEAQGKPRNSQEVGIPGGLIDFWL